MIAEMLDHVNIDIEIVYNLYDVVLFQMYY